MDLLRVHEVDKRTRTRLVTGLLIIAVLAGVMPVQTAAQTDEGSRGGGGFFSVGVQQLDAGGVDQRLAGAGLSGIGTTALTLGGGGHAVLGRWRIGGEGHGLRGSQRTAADGAFETRVSGGYGLFTVGYDLAPRSRLEVVPRLGLGSGGVTATIDGLEAPTFGEILENPRRGVRLTRSSFLASVGLAVRMPLVTPRTGSAAQPHAAAVIPGGATAPEGPGRGGKRLVLGLRAGYLLPFAEGGWSTGASRVAGGPSLKAKGFHLSLTIGW